MEIIKKKVSRIVDKGEVLPMAMERCYDSACLEFVYSLSSLIFYPPSGKEKVHGTTFTDDLLNQLESLVLLLFPIQLPF